MPLKDEITSPQKIHHDHNLAKFDSGEPVLDNWLRRRALKNEDSGASRTYVICMKNCVIGYYALAVGAVEVAKAPGKVKRNMPDPIPVVIIGRLAIDKNFQGRGLGPALLRDAVLRVVQAADIAGVRAILVHALNKDALKFYQHCGFLPSPVDTMTLMITVADAKNTLKAGKTR